MIDAFVLQVYGKIPDVQFVRVNGYVEFCEIIIDLDNDTAV